MPRKEFSAKTKAEAFQRAQGRCEDCTARLGPGNVEYDHIVPAAFDGPSTLDNCKVLCRSCHKGKTGKTDAPRIAKAKRAERKHIGARATSKRPIAGSKASGWRQKMDGTWERR